MEACVSALRFRCSCPDIRELKLIDPFYDEDERRLVSFVRDRDDPADIGGTFEVAATFITPTDWMHRDK
jgi:hypothetical protein